MPWYCYTDENGFTHERAFPMSRIPRRIKLDDGTVATRDHRAELLGIKTTPPGNWPMKSLALGCHPKQAKEYYDFTKKHGVPTLVDQRGEPVIENRRQRKELCKLFKLVDFDGGYGDYTP